MDTAHVRIGSYLVPQIGYDQVEPGDLVVTYEALTTRSDFQAAQQILRYSNIFHPPELAKMFHAEIVTKKGSRVGAYQIAHADGSARKVVSQYDCLKDHHPGQALLIFRAKNPRIREEIIKVANQTATVEADHDCTIANLQSLACRVRYFFECFIFEFFIGNTDRRILRKIAEMVVHYQDSGKFYGADGSGVKSMRCSEYVANVVNVAAVRVLLGSTPNKNTNFLDRVDSIIDKIKGLNNQFPLKLSSSQAMPSSLVHFFLNHSESFETIGYLGAITDPIEGPVLDIKGKSNLISCGRLKEVLAIEEDLDLLAEVMQTLGMLSDSFEVYSKAVRDPIKAKTFFVVLNALKSKSDPLEVCKSSGVSTLEFDFWHRNFIKEITRTIPTQEKKLLLSRRDKGFLKKGFFRNLYG